MDRMNQMLALLVRRTKGTGAQISDQQRLEQCATLWRLNLGSTQAIRPENAGQKANSTRARCKQNHIQQALFSASNQEFRWNQVLLICVCWKFGGSYQLGGLIRGRILECGARRLLDGRPFADHVRSMAG